MYKSKTKLTNIIEGMESQSDEMCSYLNIKTGEVVYITNEEMNAAEDGASLDGFPDWQKDSIEIAVDIIEGEDYLPLPSKFYIHEYDIMERFCLSIEDEKLCNTLHRSIKGSGAFRRFKDSIHRFNIEDKWYKYRDEALKDIAIDWCKRNDIDFLED